MGKTGGDTTLRLFQLFPELVQYADSAEDPGKHAPFAMRRGRVAGKARALNIRCLPSWMLAFSLHKSQRGLAPHYKSGPMESPHQMAGSRDPDRHLETFLRGGEISHWIRVEQLKQDFLGFISQYTNVTDDRRIAVEELPRFNTANYDRDISHWFTDSQVALMYENNPLWAEVETRVYGRTTSADAGLRDDASVRS
jgi:hypothetical protein